MIMCLFVRLRYNLYFTSQFRSLSLPRKKYDIHCRRCFHTSIYRPMFWEEKPRLGYTKVDEEIEKIPKKKLLLDSFNMLKEEIKVWKQEVKEKLESDSILLRRPGEIDMLFTFENSEKINKFNVTCDGDHQEGFSKATFITTQHESGLFSGYLSNRVPRDGKIKKAGYCNIMSQRVRKSFKRDSYYDWTMYTHLVFKVRGDGRSYMINLHCPGNYDVLWNDLYQYILFTRGGPYWQITKIPFSKFFVSSKGRIQDAQFALIFNRVGNVGITVGDGIEGPFSLEIDYIGLENDPNHTEEFAYEMYATEKNISGT